MVNSRFCTWLIIVVIFVLGQPVDSKKHRVLHSLPHQHRHQTHQHRKPHAKIHHNHRHHHLPLMKKFSRSITTNNSNVFFNITKFPSSTDSLANESTTLSSLGSNFSNDPNIKSVFNDTWTQPVSSQFDNFSNHFSTPTNSQNSTTFPFSSTFSSTSSSTIDDSSQKSFSNLSSSFLTNMTSELVANGKLDGSEMKQDGMVGKEAIEGIANEENLKTVTDRSMSSTRDNATTYNRERFVKELEELFGPSEEPKDLLNNVDTPLVVLVRKKRSNEEKVRAEEREPKMRTLLDFEGPETADDSENFEDSSNVFHKRVKRNDPKDFDENPYALNPNYLQDLEDSFAPSALEIQAQKSDDEMLRKSDHKLRFKRDTNYANGEIDPTIEITQNIKNDQQQMKHNDVWTDSSTQSPEKSFQNDGLSAKKDFTVMDSSPVTLFSSNPLISSPEKNEEARQSREDFSGDEKSAAEPENLQDDNSVSRYGLSDVYPDSIEDSQPESMVPLVRTKRFGEGFIYPESPEVSYANEQPDADEPYAEDNEIIDSMLNKVDERIPEDPRDAEYKKVESDVADEPEVGLRDKRDTNNSSRAERRFGYGGIRKHRKNRRRKKKKKKNRHRWEDYKKRGALLSDHEYRKEAAPFERDSSKDDEDRFHEIYDQDVMSPHDGRRRRDYEDETNDNLHYNINEPAFGQVERKLRESEAPRANGDGSMDDNASREKRGTRRDEDANDTSQTIDKNSISRRNAEPIRDIQELVQRLLVKVNELAVNMNDVKTEPPSTKNPQCSKLAAKAIAQTSSEPPKAIQQASIAEKPTGNPVNSMRRRKTCWKPASTSDRHPAKINRASKRIGEDFEGRIRRKRKPGRKWDRWTDWSSCSVTCGKGRQIRWRHCLRNCSTAETEMEEKACQFPACAPGKFLGIFG